ncbi:MAG: SGNH/GDSL hydrolase family protein [Pseudomonadales bacterium]|nr:SGNH/GDSL hydrolase family protein [Pseudomonadales bacterium]
MYKEFLLFSCTIIFSLFISENILRYFYVIPSPIGNYYPLEIAKLGKAIHIDQMEFDIWYEYNSSGFRDKEIKVKKPVFQKRILFVGDSITEGFGVSDTKRYSNQILEHLGFGYEGINVAQLATNPPTYLDNIAKFGVALKPDLVVMGFFIGNDFMGANGSPLPQSIPVNKEIDSNDCFQVLQDKWFNLYFLAILGDFGDAENCLISRLDSQDKNFWELYFKKNIDKSFFANLHGLTVPAFDKIVSGFNADVMDEIYAGRVNSSMFHESVNLHAKKPSSDKSYYIEDDYLNTYDYIKKSREILYNHQIQFLVVIIPDMDQVNSKEFREASMKDFLISEIPSRFQELRSLRERLVHDLSVDDINFIDTTNALKNSPNLSFYIYDNHLNENGHTIVGEEVYPVIEKYFE